MIKYNEYIQSEKWRLRRLEVLENPYWGRPHQCLVCHNISGLAVHHLNYDRLGDENDQDLCILCSECHHKVHFFEGRKSNKNVDIKVFQLKFGNAITPKKIVSVDKPKNKPYGTLSVRKSETGKTKKYQEKYDIPASIAVSIWVFARKQKRQLRVKPNHVINFEKYLRKRPSHMQPFIEDHKKRLVECFNEMMEHNEQSNHTS